MGSRGSLALLGLCLVLLVGSSAATGGIDVTYYCVKGNKTTVTDKELLQVALNFEYFEAEYFLWASFGYGLDKLAPDLVDGGPAPLDAQKVDLDPYYTDIFKQLGLQEIGHIRAIKAALDTPPHCAFPRTFLDLSKKTWAAAFDLAFLSYFGKKLSPPFDPYANTLNYVISAYFMPYLGLVGYVGASPLLHGYNAKKLVASLLAVEAGQDGVLRTELYRQKDKKVYPYDYTVADFSNAVSNVSDGLARTFFDEGLVVPIQYGAEKLVTGNILSADANSLAYALPAGRQLGTVYGSSNASTPAGFFPKGAQGVIAAGYLNGTLKA